MTRISRRTLLQAAAVTAVAGTAPQRANAAATGRVVVVGGGFGGVTCARMLRQIAPGIEVTLVEPNESFVTCPFSNAVIAGLADMASITHSYDGVRNAGVTVVRDSVSAIDADRKSVRLAGGSILPYDRLVLSPGIDIKWKAVEGYDEAASQIVPHAFKAGAQTMLLRRQLEEMPDGGLVVMTIPPNPFRCPPGPYERASLIAWYLKTKKPRSKLILLDAKDTFSKQGLFVEGWKALYGPLIEWVPFGQSGNLLKVDAATKTVTTEFTEEKADVLNVIPPQRAGMIVDSAGLAGSGGWCNVNPVTFESRIVPGIHIVGDAIVAGSMPKSGFSAGSQAKVCAQAIAALQAGDTPSVPSFINTCYSLVSPDYGISVVDVFRVGSEGAIAAVQGAGGVSPTGAGADFRKQEAEYARGWYASQTKVMFG
jgi:NADPH-dependent 2,4-dienoyl-CoA reductase/sulfur reductase-like enzyme